MQLHIVFFSYLYSSPYYYMYTSFAVVAGDISHETDNIDEQVKNIRIQSNNIQETQERNGPLLMKNVGTTKLKPLRNDCRFFFVLLF